MFKRFGMILGLIIASLFFLSTASPAYDAGMYGGLVGGNLYGGFDGVGSTGLTDGDGLYHSSLATLATPINIPSYGYPYSPYVTSFPDLTSPEAVSPYVSFSYPYYTSSGLPYPIYSTWSLLNGATYGLSLSPRLMISPTPVPELGTNAINPIRAEKVFYYPSYSY